MFDTLSRPAITWLQGPFRRVQSFQMLFPSSGHVVMTGCQFEEWLIIVMPLNGSDWAAQLELC